MTHAYVICVNGEVDPRAPDATESDATRSTAIAWAADHVLAVGTDEAVRAISRGDSTFLDLHGCVVTALPAEPAQADAVVRRAARTSGGSIDLRATLIDTGLLGPDSTLEPGSPADLAFWDVLPGPGDLDEPPEWGLLAIVRGGAFMHGDEHRGPFPVPGDPSSPSPRVRR
jgi:hypothetical protein